ncbi:hypothetical protein ACFYMW_00460 [Streptomyces sp. NPDC006692]|uniref:hypothetical protein n=1 Tax=Streptomyces sp. NPDC006692 TaxID=3364758 RepID=UPI0036A6E469
MQRAREGRSSAAAYAIAGGTPAAETLHRPSTPAAFLMASRAVPLDGEITYTRVAAEAWWPVEAILSNGLPRVPTAQTPSHGDS